jgi:citrate lyase beta subunit
MADARPSLLEDADVHAALKRLESHDAAYAARYPGDSAQRQPVHTVYGGAQLFRADAAPKLGRIAQRMLDEYAPDADTFSSVLGVGDAHAELVHRRVRERLAEQAVEDFRIDFEDGYGNRPDTEEDGHARAAAQEVARGMREGLLPPYIGARIKSVAPDTRSRALRTLEIFVTALVEETGGALPSNFVVTLPKVTAPAQAAFFADVLEALESRIGLEHGLLRFELMVETPQILIGADGTCPLPHVLQAARGRASAAHFGTYDYTAACGITAAEQRMQHPACDHARHIMQVALAGTGVWLSDGSTAVLPVPPHRAAPDGSLTPARAAENRDVVQRAWKLHYDDVQDSLARGFYQGWDLHPAQLVTRYAALYDFFLRGLDAAAGRLSNFLEKAAQATLLGEVFDDAATGQGLLNYFLRAINAGAVTEEETLQRTGLTHEELRGRSFLLILKNRTGSA